MGRTAIERLPQEIRDQVEAWLREFHDGRLSLDEVMTRMDASFGDQLGDALPSRSSVHRHAQKYQALGERLRRSKAIADQLVEQVGPELRDGKGFQVLVHGFQSLAFDMLANMDEEQTMDPENLMFFSRAIASVASAQKTDTDRALRLKQEAAREAAAAVDRVAKRDGAGLTRDTVDAIKREILGITD